MDIEDVHEDAHLDHLLTVKITILGNLADKDDLTVGGRDNRFDVIRRSALGVAEKVNREKSQAETDGCQAEPAEAAEHQCQKSEKRDKWITLDSYWLMPVTHN
jgi:hypothetical protein